MKLMQQRLYDIQRIVRSASAGGLIISETGTRNVAMSAGSVWVKLDKSSISAFDSSGVDRFDRYYRDGVGGWTKQSDQSQWDNTQYDDNSGSLATLGNNKYSYQDFYLEADGAIVCLYGQNEYNTLAEAELAGVAASVPGRIEDHALYIGRFIFQKSAVSATVLSAFTFSFAGAVVTSHTELADIGTFTHAQLDRRYTKQTPSYATPFTLDLANGYYAAVSITGDMTINVFSTLSPGIVSMEINVDGSDRTITLNASIISDVGKTFVLEANSKNTFYFDNDGTTVKLSGVRNNQV